MPPLLSQMPLSLSPWPPSFKLQILIQIRSLAQSTSTSCKNITTVGWNARWVLVSWDGQSGLKDFGPKIWRFKMFLWLKPRCDLTESPASLLSGALLISTCWSVSWQKCIMSALEPFYGRWIFNLPICLLFMLWIIMWQWPMSHCGIKLLCLGSQCIWYSTFQVSALPLDKQLQSSQTFPKENYFRNI